MPWPWEMGRHIIDPQTLRPRFWPWPQKDWKFNRLALDAIQTVYMADHLMRKQPAMWTAEDDKFYEAVINESEQINHVLSKQRL